MNKVTVSQVSLRNEIIDSLVICALFLATAFIWEGLAFRILLLFGFIMAIIELLVSSHLAKKAAKDSSNLGSLLELIVLLVATAIMAHSHYESKTYVLWIGVVTASDAFGLFFGRFFGEKRPFFSRKISPNKTYAGYLGEILGSIAGGWLIILLLDMPLSLANLAYVHCCFVFSATGDLIGSAAKRELGVKNSDELLLDLPILGKIEKLMRSRHGFMDCLDSASLALIFYAILIAGCP